MKFSKLIFRNLFRNKLRAMMTALLIAVVFFFVATLLAILENFDSYADASAGTNRLAVQSAISLANALPYSHEAKIRQIDGIVEVSKLQWFGGYYKEPDNFFANFAVDVDKMEKVWDDYKVPPDQFAAFKADRLGALVGPELMERFKWKIGDRIHLKSTIFPLNPELTIRAVYKHPIDSSSLFFHMTYFNESRAMGGGNLVGTFWIKVKDPNQMTSIAQQIDAMFKNSEYPTETFTEKEFQLNFMAMMGNIKLLFRSISICSIFMVVLLAAITMSMSARERVTEIAVLKAIGFERGLILSLMLAEFILLTLIGGLLGTVGAKIFFNFVNMAEKTNGFLVNFFIPTETVMICLGASVIVGFIAGGLPAWRGASLSVVDGLRRVV